MRDEWACLGPASVTTLDAWFIAVGHALRRVDRPKDTVVVAVHAQESASTRNRSRHEFMDSRPYAALADGRDASVVWLSRHAWHPEMARAQMLAYTKLTNA